MTVHSEPLEARQWWACTQPERPADIDTCFDGYCRGCLLAMQAHLIQHGSDYLVKSMIDDLVMPLDAVVEAALARLEEGPK